MNPSYYDDLRIYIQLTIILSIIVVTGLIVFLSVSKLWARPMKDARFRGRDALTLDEFYQRFYADEGFARDTVHEVLVSFAEAGRLPHGLLRPQDSFEALHVPGSQATKRLAQAADKLIKERELRYGVRVFEGQVSTLDDYIRVYCLAQRLGSRRGSAGS